MKLDLNAAWDQAVRLVALNREVMLVLAGVFFFLPMVLFQLLVPIPEFAELVGPSGESTPALMAAVKGFMGDYWWAIVLSALIQTAGGTAAMAVVGDPARPTVGEAMRRGGAFLLPAVATQILTSCLTLLVLFLAILIGLVAGSQAAAATAVIFAVPVIVWLMTRLSLATPAIAIEKIANPVAALQRSWQLTRGNGLRLLVFYVLLFLAFFVISQVTGLIVSLLTALPGSDLAAIIGALLTGLTYAVLIVIGYAVLASVHRQLARAERVSVPGRPRAS